MSIPIFMTTFLIRAFFCFFAVIALTTEGLSHPGHGNTEDGNSLMHYLWSPIHFLPLILCIGVTLLLVVMQRKVYPRYKQRRAS